MSARGRVAVIIGSVSIVLATIAGMFWLLRDPYVPFTSGLDSQRLKEVAQQLDRAKVEYRVDDGAAGVAVPRSQLGRAHAATAGSLDIPPSVGLELFKETDFSSTDFAQRINYQRALQGELTRTIQTITSVRNARVHVILPDAGVFKRNAARATAAVTVTPQPGAQLTRAQVRGIQRLVAASVPEMKVDDVVVLDDSGTSLTRAPSDAPGEIDAARLDLKRQVDQYLESKLLKLLQELAPEGSASLSVDALLEDRELRVTSDEPLAAHGAKNAERATGVLVKERQARHGANFATLQTDADAEDNDSGEREREYVVGHRTEQMVVAPGAIKRVTVAAAMQGAPAYLTREVVEQLVANAVGIDPSRGDSVVVLLLPAASEHSASQTIASSAAVGTADPEVATSPLAPVASDRASIVLIGALIVALLIIAWLGRAKIRGPETSTVAEDVDIEGVTGKVTHWLNEGANDARA
jgi:flagellar M-ring protein FliF